MNYDLNENGLKINKLYSKKGSNGYEPFFEGYVNIEYLGERCTEDSHGLRVICSNYDSPKLFEDVVTLNWHQEEEMYYLSVSPISVYDNKSRKLKVIDDKKNYDKSCEFGPKKRIFVEITQGKHKGKSACLDLTNDIWILEKSKKSSSNNSNNHNCENVSFSGNGKKEKCLEITNELGNSEFQYFRKHTNSEYLYGFIYRARELKNKNIFIFNVNNKKIHGMAVKKSARPNQIKIVKDMVIHIQEILEESLVEYQENINKIEFKNQQELIDKYGSEIDYYLHVRFKYIIESYIKKFYNE